MSKQSPQPSGEQRATVIRPDTAVSHYQGERAASYDSDRTRNRKERRKWNREIAAVEGMLASLPPCLRILDMPCGTGRFLSLLSRCGHRAVGGDLSLDMIRQIPAHRRDPVHLLGLVICEGARLPFRDDSFDYALCMRFLNLVPVGTVHQAVAEMLRVSRRGLILEIRLLGDVPIFDDAVRWLRNCAARLLRRLVHPRVKPKSACEPSKRRPLPPASGFRRFCRELGLRTERIETIGWSRLLLQPDPLRVFHLEQSPGDPPR